MSQSNLSSVAELPSEGMAPVIPDIEDRGVAFPTSLVLGGVGLLFSLFALRNSLRPRQVTVEVVDANPR